MSSFAVHISVCALLAVDFDNSKGGSRFGRFSRDLYGEFSLNCNPITIALVAQSHVIVPKVTSQVSDDNRIRVCSQSAVIRLLCRLSRHFVTDSKNPNLAAGGKGMEWEIVHVPGEISGSKDSAVTVVAANVEPKLASAILRELSQIAPLENLRHVKRIRRRPMEGKNELSVVLCPLITDENELGSIQDNVQKLIDKHGLILFTAKVPKHPATSKEEWEEQCKLWPTTYHPTPNANYQNKFSVEDTQWIISCMKTTFMLANHLGNQVTNAAMIVDPLCQQIIASASDQRVISIDTAKAHLKSLSKVNNENFEKVFQEYSTEKSTEECKSVSCLHPWIWAQNSSQDLPWHPLKHAAIAAVENSAARDRQLFPRNSPSKRQKTENPKDLTEPPYLCTGYDIYLMWEPCTMCAMALVHQRFRRIFFAFPNPNAGALGSVYRLQGERSLNHHYSVFWVSASRESTS